MKTAVSLPDRLAARVDQAARRQGKSRSLLYREAIVAYLAEHETAGVTEQLDRALRAIRPQPVPAVQTAARRTLERNEW